jgi:hypothetical protein
MLFKDLEAKKAYNKAYYERNRIKINADRIIKDVKNKEQRCIMQSTIEKYDEGFDGNQILFLDGLIKNCQLERKQLYEMPEPAPILKVPIEPKDILCPKVA